MPTVILLDVSLSMSRPVQSTDGSEPQTRLTIAAAAINSFFDYLSLHAKLEYVALVTFSSLYEVVVPFTRDFDNIRSKLLELEEGDKTCIETALAGVNQLVLNEWGNQNPVQIIFITDGNCGVGAIGRSRIIQALPLPPSYPAKIYILPIVSPNDTCLQQAMPLYQKIIDMASANHCSNGPISRGVIYCPEHLNTASPCITNNYYVAQLREESIDESDVWFQQDGATAHTSRASIGTCISNEVVAAMNKLCEQQYQEFWCVLKCGQLESKVQLFPAPQPALHEDLAATCTIAHQIHVIGFLTQQELGTPIAISKHLVLPQAQVGTTNNNRESYGSKTPTKDGSSTDGSTTEEDVADPSKVPNFCVLLHGALKVEGMAAIVQLGPDWWGAVSAWCEATRARRSCLLLSAFRPGHASAPWLGPLTHLGPADDPNATEAFPVRSWRSYSSGGSACAWARPHALLADVQKVLRHARKLPEKTQHLYKELNRLRRAAISLGFSELLSCVGTALERECAALPPSSPPECALQLAHAAAALRDHRTVLDIKHTLQPLAPNFTVPSM